MQAYNKESIMTKVTQNLVQWSEFRQFTCTAGKVNLMFTTIDSWVGVASVTCWTLICSSRSSCTSLQEFYWTCVQTVQPLWNSLCLCGNWNRITLYVINSTCDVLGTWVRTVVLRSTSRPTTTSARCASRRRASTATTAAASAPAAGRSSAALFRASKTRGL